MQTKSPIISVSDLYQKINDINIRIIDTRFSLFNKNEGKALFDKSHITGAIYADLDKDLAGNITASSGRHPLPNVNTISGKLREWGINKLTNVIVYDHNNGSIASRLWWLLKWLGHERVSVLDGGFLEWEKSNFPIDNSISNYEPGNFVPVLKEDKTWTAELINKWIKQSKKFFLIDARDENRYRGIEEPIDRKAGHIPGAINIPFTLFLEENGVWKNLIEIRAIWKKYQVNDNVEWAVMCGSGVTACHLSISAELVGLSSPKLYPGSWSEWISDNNRPIVNG
tara:strand:- start:1036 stop:1884 length:849 start_codon:yes stop_codon:yes gene_type:complete